VDSEPAPQGARATQEEVRKLSFALGSAEAAAVALGRSDSHCYTLSSFMHARVLDQKHRDLASELEGQANELGGWKALRGKRATQDPCHNQTRQDQARGWLQPGPDTTSPGIVASLRL
jgi:hypothetical protein